VIPVIVVLASPETATESIAASIISFALFGEN